MKQLKTTLLTVALLFSVNTLMAQQKYEYATFNYFPSKESIVVSIDGHEAKKIKVEKDIVEGFGTLNPVLSEVNKMEDDGWELFNNECVSTSGLGLVYNFYFRRKEQ